MSQLPWMQFHTADWIQDTRVLSPMAKGVWIDLICFMFSRDKGFQGELTHSVIQFSRMAGTTPEEMLQALDEFRCFNICDVTPDVTHDVTQVITIISRRMKRDCKKRTDTAARVHRHREAKKNNNVSKSGLKESVTQNVTLDVTQKVTDRVKSIELRDKSIPPKVPQVGDDPDGEEYILNLSGDVEAKGPKRRKAWTRKQVEAEVYEDYPNFGRWWKAYPNGSGKRKAFDAWVKLGLEFEDPEKLLGSIRDHQSLKQWQDEDGKYIPLGATFLNQRQFEDDLSGKKISGGGQERPRFAHG